MINIKFYIIKLNYSIFKKLVLWKCFIAAESVVEIFKFVKSKMANPIWRKLKILWNWKFLLQILNHRFLRKKIIHFSNILLGVIWGISKLVIFLPISLKFFDSRDAVNKISHNVQWDKSRSTWGMGRGGVEKKQWENMRTG